MKVRGAETQLVRTHNPREATHKWEKDHNARRPPEGTRCPNPTLGSYTGKTNLQNVCLRKPVGLMFGRDGGLWKTDSALRGHEQNLTHFKSQHRSSSLESSL